MSAPRVERKVRNRIILLVICGVLVVAAVVGLIVGLVGSGSGSRPAAPSSTPSAVAPSASPTSSAGSNASGVDPSVTDLGLIVQPITPDLETYATAAARAIVTLDAQKIDRRGFLDYLTTWIGGDARFKDNYGLEKKRDGTRAEISQFVIGGDARWEALAAKKTVITATVSGAPRVDSELVSMTPALLDELLPLGLHNVTVDVIVTTSQDDGTGQGRYSSDSALTVSMQIQCGQSLPLSNTVQGSSDCTLIRWFPEPMN